MTKNLREARRASDDLNFLNMDLHVYFGQEVYCMHYAYLKSKFTEVRGEEEGIYLSRNLIVEVNEWSKIFYYGFI